MPEALAMLLYNKAYTFCTVQFFSHFGLRIQKEAVQI